MPGVTLSNEIYEIVERSPVHLFQNDRSTLQANSRIPVFTRDSDTTTPWEEGEGGERRSNLALSFRCACLRS